MPQPAAARSSEAGSRRSPMTVSTGNSATRLPGRTSARTAQPRSIATRATCHPRKPDAPVTRTGFMAVCLRGAGCQACCVESHLDISCGREKSGLSQHPCQHLEIVGHAGVDAVGNRRLEAAVHHAVLATRVVAGAVAFPRRTRHQILERLVLPVGDQVARTLPALDVVSGIAPSGARQLAPALQEFHVQRGLANRVFRGDAVEVAELFAYVVARQENLAVVDGD